MIRIRSLSKVFRQHAVLDGLTLDVAAGDRVALIGSNGAGKTTLIRCLLGEYTYTGDVAVLGLSPRNDRRAILARVGFVPQLPPPLKMPVSELIRFSAAVSGCGQEGILAVLRQLGLDYTSVGAKPFVKLSGGQKQKILAAIAFGRPTELLILDEPTANLDPAARRSLFELLAARTGQPMIISSHRLEEVAGLVNRVIELDHGKVALDDRLAEDGDPTARYACVLTVSRPEPAFAQALAPWGFSGDAAGLSWRGDVAGADRLRFLAMLARYGGLLTGMRLDAPEVRKANGAWKPGSQAREDSDAVHPDA